MKHILTKLSEPGWEVEYSTLKEVEYKLLECICSECKEELMDEIIAGGNPVDEALCTPCGCEFYYEKVE